MSVVIDAQEVFALARRFDGGAEIVNDELTTSMKRLGLATEGFAKAEVGVVTGTLRRSITSQVKGSGGSITAEIGTQGVPYARIHHDGRGPVVARGRALHFFIGGVEFFRKSVGPAKANPFMDKAIARVKPMVAPEIGAAVGRAIGRMFGG
jgi:hypothetical protein